MANAKIIERKAQVVEEIANKVKEASTAVLFEYQGLTVSETNEQIGRASCRERV